MTVGEPRATTETLTDRIERLLAIQKAMSADDPPSVEALAGLLGVSLRTIERDLRFLRESEEIPLDEASRTESQSQCDDARFALDPEDLLELLCQALVTGVPVLNRQRDRSRRAAEILASGLSEDQQRHYRELNDRVRPCSGSSSETLRIAGFFELFTHALRRRRCLRVSADWGRSGNVSIRDLQPLRLRFQDGAWVLDGVTAQSAESAVIALEQVQRVERSLFASVALEEDTLCWDPPDIALL